MPPIKLILDNNPIIKWPAIILAAKRIDNVNGRIKCLTLSIMTIKKDNTIGLPSGTKWAALFLNPVTQPIEKKDIHNTTPKPKVIQGWAIKVKIKGKSPIKFLNIKYKNIINEIYTKPI